MKKASFRSTATSRKKAFYFDAGGKDILGTRRHHLQRRQPADPADPDGAASRAYYAAFNAVSALFALDGKSFRKHTAIEGAVHRELVKTGRWPVELGKTFSSLLEARATGDYGQDLHISADIAGEILQSARRILEAVHEENPETFPADFQ